MDETISMKEALELIVKSLEEINVPVKYALQIAKPLNDAVFHLHNCIAAMEEPAEGPEAPAEG